MKTSLLGAPLDRVDGRAKVTGAATYAAEYAPDGRVYAAFAQATIPKGRIARIDTHAASAVPGVLAVISHENAPPITPDDPWLRVLVDDRVRYTGEPVALVVAETSEAAREAVAAIVVAYEREAFVAVLDDETHATIVPEQINGGFETDTRRGELGRGFAESDTVLDLTYATPYQHNNPLEPHATTAWWTDDGITLWDADQGVHGIAGDVATTFGLQPAQVRVIAPYVGGGFGSKAFTHPHVVLAVQASRVTGRPVTLSLTRQQMFGVVGHRTRTLQRLRLGAKRDGTLHAIAHDVVTQTSSFEVFAEQVAEATRHIYAAPHRRTTHRVVRLDLPSPNIMRAPGETPGVYALECAVDELAHELGIDPIVLRERNEPARDPEQDLPFSTRHWLACFHEGARRFGWAERPRTPRERRAGNAFVGYGVAGATYPTRRRPSSAAARAEGERFIISLGAADIGTGAWTMLVQVAADALEVPPDRIEVRIGDSHLPKAPIAGGSMGAISWGTAVHEACLKLRERVRELGGVPPDGVEVTAQTGEPEQRTHVSSHAWGAHFCEVHVDRDTAELRVARMTSIYDVGRVLNAKTARSQLLGGTIMGIGMALHEATELDPRDAHWVTHDLEQYHIPTHADIGVLEADWLDVEDTALNPLGAKGLGEIGIVGVAAAVANAVFNATGVRVREVPIRLDALLPYLD